MIGITSFFGHAVYVLVVANNIMLIAGIAGEAQGDAGKWMQVIMVNLAAFLDLYADSAFGRQVQ